MSNPSCRVKQGRIYLFPLEFFFFFCLVQQSYRQRQDFLSASITNASVCSATPCQLRPKSNEGYPGLMKMKRDCNSSKWSGPHTPVIVAHC